jgi:hypothetical protein
MSALTKVEKKWAVKAAALLEPHRFETGARGIVIGEESADRLQMSICEALVKAYEAGKDAQRLEHRLGSDG